MKPSGKILEEITVKSCADFSETIAKLQAQQGPCSDPDSYGNRKWFTCSKKGVIRFTNAARDYGGSIYFVEGRVEEQDGETVVKIYSLKSNFEKYHRWFEIILNVVVICAMTVISIKMRTPFTTQNGVLLVLWALSTAITIHNTRQSEKHKDYNLNVMKNEIIERVEAIKRWDE